MSKWIHFFNILTLLFCMLQGITRFYSDLVANIFITLELICFVVVVVLFTIGMIRIKREEKRLKEKLREDFLKFLNQPMENTLKIEDEDEMGE